MALSTTRRFPFTTYMPTAKRRRTMTRSTIRTLPVRRNATPEIKQWISSSLLTNAANGASASIPTLMTQGDDGNDFLGSKFRILRVRIYYDYTTVTPSDSIRMILGVPKDPSNNLMLTTTSGQSQVLPANYFSTTVLKEKYLKTDGSDHAGYMEWTGPLNVEMTETGASPLKNNLVFQVNSTGQGLNLAQNSRTRIEVLFTG